MIPAIFPILTGEIYEGGKCNCTDNLRSDIDGWEIRRGMGDLAAMDLVPDPQIVAAALRACRRINDFSLTTRYWRRWCVLDWT